MLGFPPLYIIHIAAFEVIQGNFLRFNAFESNTLLDLEYDVCTVDCPYRY